MKNRLETEIYTMSNQLNPMNRLYVEEYTLLDGSTTIKAGYGARDWLNISKAGYYPVTISGYNSNKKEIVPYRLQLEYIASGDAQIAWGVYNTATSERAPTFTVRVLWEKIN